MSAAPWKTTARPHSPTISVSRSSGATRKTAKLESHTFPAKTPNRAIALKAAQYKYGFQRVVEVLPLSREEWDREFPKGGPR